MEKQPFFRHITAKHVVVFVYFGAFLALASIALWDASELISEYFGDHRLTVVKHENITDTFPFLKPGSKICVEYGYDWFLPSGTMRKTEFFETVRRRWFGEEISVPPNVTASQWANTTHVFDLMLPYVVMRMLDYHGFNYTANYWRSHQMKLDINDLSSLTDRFVKSFTSIEHIQETQLKLQSLVSIADPAPKLMDILYFDFTQLCLKPALHERIRANNRRVSFSLDIIYPRNGDTVEKFGTRPINVFIPPSDSVAIQPGRSDVRLVNTITTESNGVYDLSKYYPHCTDEYPTEAECLAQTRQDIIETVCNCSQYSKYLGGIRRPPVETRFCTFQIYQECWAVQNALDQANKNQELPSGDCKICTVPKNFHTITLDSYARDQAEIENAAQFYRAKLVFECLERSYLFWEQSEETLPQFLSQLGGNLGLYIGFSMMSVLQVILFAYHMHQQRKKIASAHANGNISNWIQLLFRYIMNNVHDFEREERRENEMQQLKCDNQQLKAKVDALENGLYMLINASKKRPCGVKRAMSAVNGASCTAQTLWENSEV